MNDSFIKIEHNVASYGEVIEGNYTGISLVRVLDYDVEINESLKAVYIYTKSDGGVVHGYLEKHYGVYNIPYYKNGFEIIDIYENGAVRIHFKNMEIVLSSGEEWKISTSIIDTQSFNLGDEEIFGKALFTTTYSIVNHGFVEKSSLSNSTFNVVEV